MWPLLGTDTVALDARAEVWPEGFCSLVLDTALSFQDGRPWAVTCLLGSWFPSLPREGGASGQCCQIALRFTYKKHWVSKTISRYDKSHLKIEETEALRGYRKVHGLVDNTLRSSVLLSFEGHSGEHQAGTHKGEATTSSLRWPPIQSQEKARCSESRTLKFLKAWAPFKKTWGNPYKVFGP